MDKNTGSSMVTENNREGNMYYFSQCFEKHRLSLSVCFSDVEPFEILDKIIYIPITVRSALLFLKNLVLSNELIKVELPP